MDFGKTDNIEGIDFTLPPDPLLTRDVLRQQRTLQAMKVYSGCAKWGKKEWIGKLYPKGAKEKDFLHHYVKHFNCIELNATHYKIYPASTICKWRDAAPAGFKFCPKYPKVISHDQMLADATWETEEFCKAVLHFEDRLGPCFLQLPPHFAPQSFLSLETYLKNLPREMITCVELRNPQWFEDVTVREEVFAMFAENGIGTVITDAAGRRDVLHMFLTLPVAFIRFAGNALHPTDYTRVNEWIGRISEWKKEGLKEAYFFMHQHAELDSPQLSGYFAEEVSRKLEVEMMRPSFIDPAAGQYSLF